MDKVFTFSMRDVVNVLFVYAPAALGWLVLAYLLTHARRGKL